jgi:long-chain acyl-CoA synthetase
MNQTSTYCPVEVSPNDHAVYIFSSGTTGIKQIKAVMLTQENLASNILATDHVLDAIKGGICLSGVADNTHSFEHFLQLWILHNGMQLSYTDLAGFMRGEVAKIQPHYMIMIPKIANVIMDGIKRRFEEQGRLDLLEKALGYSAEYYRKALRGEPFSLKARFYHELANLTIYAKIRKGLREKFGKNLRLVVGGSAPLAPSTQEFFVAVGNHRLWIMQGYGLTETSPVVCVNTRQHYRIGSSGRVIPGVKVLIANTQKLSDCREIVEVKDGEEGELLINGPNVFAGYFDAPEKNQKAFVGGWFCTGDRAKIERVSDSSDLGPFLYITGRTKNLLVFGNGQKLAPEPIEAHYEAELAKTISRFVCVGGESIRELLHEDVEKFPLSVIVVPQEQVQQDILAGRIKEQEVIAKIQTGVRDSYQRFGFGIRGVVIDLNYNSAVDETPSRKLKRDAFLQSRVELVRRLYS